MKLKKSLSLTLAAALALSLNTQALAAGYGLHTYGGAAQTSGYRFHTSGGTAQTSGYSFRTSGGTAQTSASTPADDRISGSVASISKFGHLITDITQSAFQNAGYELGDIVTVTVDGHSLDAPYGDNYDNVDTGKLIVLPNKGSGTMSVAINYGNISTTYNVKAGDAITFTMKQKAGYLDEYNMRNIDSLRTNNRSDYASDAAFANFRPIVMGNIAPGVLYRSSSPVNPELGRNTYADQLTKAAGIKTVINLADSEAAMKAYPGYAQTYYSTLNVLPLDMSVDYKSPDFSAKLKTGFEYMISHEGPYLNHCTEGKDRTGFVSALLEMLMGGTLDQITADYMVSYENFYHIPKGPGRYDKIMTSNILPELRYIAGLDEGADLKNVNLQQAAENYLTKTVGLTPDQVSALKTVLSTPVSK